MEQPELQKIAVGDIVADDFRTSSLFKTAGIDFCCGGKQSLANACSEKGINAAKLESDLRKVMNEPATPGMNFKEWELGFLCDYIVNTHHKFVSKKMPELVFYTDKIATVHGDHHPELVEVAKLFAQINTELLQHLEKEETVFFPAIKEAAATGSEKSKETIKSEIERLSGEHDFAGGAMDEINKITGGYKLPVDACNTYRVTFQLLEQFEDDLHIHVHLENNILFSKAMELAG